METKSKKIMISVAAISMFILLTFLAPITLASGGPYLTVFPSAVVPGGVVRVIGYGFPSGVTVYIYMDDPWWSYGLLGSVVASPTGSFVFTFIMQSSTVGTHYVYACYNYYGNYDYWAAFTLQNTNPLDQRLINYMSSLYSTIYSEVSSATSTIAGDISSATSTLAGDISGAQAALAADIASSTSSIESNMAGNISSLQSSLESWMTAYVTSNTKNTALVVQASESTQGSGTWDGADIWIQVNRADNGAPVTGDASNITVTFVYSSISGGQWAITGGPIAEWTPGSGTYFVYVEPWSHTTSSGIYAVFRIDVTAVISGVTYRGSTLATVIAVP
jgi:hypothetical protein